MLAHHEQSAVRILASWIYTSSLHRTSPDQIVHMSLIASAVLTSLDYNAGNAIVRATPDARTTQNHNVKSSSRYFHLLEAYAIHMAGCMHLIIRTNSLFFP
jgi:hypothetical protein